MVLHEALKLKIGILQFAKTPISGSVKTRLMGVLSATEACRLHQQLLTVVAQEISTLDKIHHEIWSTEESEFIHRLSKTLAVPHLLQKGSDLGERLAHAFCHAFKAQDIVIVVGSDCPFLDSNYYRSAIDSLVTSNIDVVIGPALDGGYVLLGMKAYYPDLFQGIDWGSEKVLEQTLAKAVDCQLRVDLLAPLRDIDTPEDLAYLPAGMLHRA